MGKTSSMIAISLVLAMLLMGCAPRTTADMNMKAADGIKSNEVKKHIEGNVILSADPYSLSDKGEKKR